MGGIDKGLLAFQGRPLVSHAIQRLENQTIPIGSIRINANRQLQDYQSLGLPVLVDSHTDFAGPLAGFLAGMENCSHTYLLSVPCDSPFFPLDLAEKMAAHLSQSQADIAVAAACDADGVVRIQPVFCLMKATLKDHLQAFLSAGGRKIDAWTACHQVVHVLFDDPHEHGLAFRNFNTLADLQAHDSTTNVPMKLPPQARPIRADSLPS